MYNYFISDMQNYFIPTLTKSKNLPVREVSV
ncbi:hypothetical protein EAVNVH72_02801 [Elizabethkingia anophelis]|nr:hypothetical protein EAVNVH72_02801 [Elizabethkingia anophelis]